MATALITVNGTAGSKTNINYSATVNLANDNNTGVTTWNWYLLSQPAGTPTDALTTPTSSTSTFTASKEGSYLIKLVVNAGLAGEATDQVVVAVRELETGNRIPAAGETIEVSPTEGWANAATNPILQTVTRLQNNGIIAGILSPTFVGTMSAGTVVYVSGDTTLGANENERHVPIFDKALATTQSHMNGVLGLLLKSVTAGAGSAAANERIQVQLLGAFPGTFTMAAGGAIGDKVYVSDTGTLSLTAGTISRHLGTVSYVAGTTYRVFFIGYDGGASGSSTPTGPAGGVLSGTYPNPSAIQAVGVSHQIPLLVGTGNVAGDEIILKAQDGTGLIQGSDLRLTAGAALGTGVGGDIHVTAGASSVASGTVYISTPNSTNAGSIQITIGDSTAAGGEDLTLTAGATSASAFLGGTVYAKGGSSTNGTNSAGGSAVLQGGWASDNTNQPANISAGGSSKNAIVVMSGSATVAGGDASTANAIGGDVVVKGGATTGTGTPRGGNLSALGGNSTNGQGGAITIEAGDSTNNQGGNVLIKAGDSNVAYATGGNVDIQAGTNGEAKVRLNGTGGVILGNTQGGVAIGRASVLTSMNGLVAYSYSDITIASTATTITPTVTVCRLLNNTGGTITLASKPTITLIGAYLRILLVNATTNAIILQSDPHLPDSKLKLGANTRTLNQWSVLELIQVPDGLGSFYWLEIAHRL